MNYTPEEVRELIQREEGLYLERKSLWDRSGDQPHVRDRKEVRDQIAKYVAAFANAEGGILILGADPVDRTPTGHGYPEEALQEFAKVPRTRLTPELSVEMQRVTLEGQELLIFEIPDFPEAVMVTGDGFPLRVQDTVVLESQERINARKQAARNVAYEQVVRPEATLDDLDLSLAREFLRSTPPGNRPVEEVLHQYRLVKSAGQDLRITNAALLLFPKDVGRWHPRARVRLFRVEGTERRHGAERNVKQFEPIELPLARLIPEVHQRCADQIHKSEKLHDLLFHEFPEYPTFAWQEAVVNAVAHRDYGEQGREIEVWFYDDRMEVVSPGVLVPPVTLEDLRARRSVHLSRNPLIVRVFVEAGLMREEGEGIPRMFAEMEGSFLQPPRFDEEAGLFRVTLFNQPILDAGNLEWQSLVDRLPVSTRQKRVLVAHPTGFTSGDYQKLNGLDRDQTYREIQELVEKDIVVSPGKRGRGALYRISPDLASSRLWLEERVPKLRQHFRDHEKLTNTEYRGLFGLQRYRAALELGRLRDAGILSQRGEKRGTHYLPASGLERRQRRF